MEEHNATFTLPMPSRTPCRECMARRYQAELLRAAMLTARAVLADVNGGAVDDDRAGTITRVGNAYQILDMAIEDDDKLARRGMTPTNTASIPYKVTILKRDWSKADEERMADVSKLLNEQYLRSFKIKKADVSGEAEPKHRGGYVKYADDFPIGTPDQIPAGRPDEYRWADRLADEAGVVGGQGRSGGEMVASAIIMIAGAALIAGVIAAAWIMRLGN